MLLGAQALQEEYRKDLTLKEAEVLALSTLKQVMEEKVCFQLAHCQHSLPLLVSPGWGLLRCCGHLPQSQRDPEAFHAGINSTVCPDCSEALCGLVTKLLVTDSQSGELVCLLCGQITPTNVDIAAVAPTYHLYSQAEIEEVVSRL